MTTKLSTNLDWANDLQDALDKGHIPAGARIAKVKRVNSVKEKHYRNIVEEGAQEGSSKKSRKRMVAIEGLF
jgi:hypothetical protein